MMKYNCSVCTKDLHDQDRVYSWTPYIAPSADEVVITAMYYACSDCYESILNVRRDRVAIPDAH